MISKDGPDTRPTADERRIFHFDAFRFDADDRVLWREDLLVTLPPKTCDLLAVFVENPGRLITRDELMSTVWENTFVEEANLSHHIAVLRRALGGDREGRDYIQTIPRKGYRFAMPVSDGDSAAVEITLTERTTAEITEEIELDTAEVDLLRTGRDRLLRAGTRSLAGLLLLVAIGGAAIVWLRSATGERARRVPRLVPVTAYTGHEVASAMSPDGQFVAYCGTDLSTTIKNPGEPRLFSAFNIYVKQADGESVVQLTNKQGRAMSPAFSPDGRFIAYAQRPPPEVSRLSELFIIPAFGGTERKVHEALELSTIAWSPDGETLAFDARESETSPHSLFVISIETREVRRLTNPADADDGEPAFSPDGQYLSFNRSRDKTSEIFIIPVAGGVERQVTRDNRVVFGPAPWTRDGRSLVFSSNRVNGAYRLWRIPVDRGEPALVTGAGDNAVGPSLSADGRRLTYTRQQIDYHIWQVPLENRKGLPAEAQKIVASSRQNRCPALSPDGRRISFVSNQNTPARQVWVADADGRNQKQLTSFTDGTIATRTMWSPDGAKLVFDAAADGTSAIYLLNVESGVPQRMTDATTDATAPSWSQDGRSIYFARQADKRWQVWKMPVDGGEAVQVTFNGGYEAHESPDGQFLYFNKAIYGTIGLFRQRSDGSGTEEKVLDLIQVDSLGEWAVTNAGVYFLYRNELGSEAQAQNPGIKYFDLTSKKLTDVWSFGFNPFGHPGLSVSANERSVYFSINEKSDIDIMLVEDFE